MPVERTDVEQCHKVNITQQLQQGWDQYPGNAGQLISRDDMVKLQ